MNLFVIISRKIITGKISGIIFLFLWFFLIYSEIPFVIGGGKLIPSIGFFALIPFVFPFIYKEFKVSHFVFVLSMFLLATFTVVNKLDVRLLSESIIKLFQFVYSLVVCVTTFLLLSKIPETVLKKGTFLFLMFIVVATITERLGLTSALSEKFRTLYEDTNYGAEIDAEREINIAGFVRPYVFTSEPSFAGLGFFAFSTYFFCIAKTYIAEILLLFVSLIMSNLLGSPTVLFAPFFMLFVFFVKHSFKAKIKIAITSLLFTSLIVLVATGVIQSIFSGFIVRVSEEIITESSSIYVRMIVPYAITIPTVIASYPLFGVGLGNFNYINLLFNYPYYYYEEDSVYIQGANGFATILCYFGIIGTILFLGVIKRFCLKNEIKNYLLVILFIFLLGQITNGISTPRFWGYIGIAFAIFRILQKKNAV